MGSGLMLFFFGYLCSFVVFILGYKRWNRKYQEGYDVDTVDPKDDDAESELPQVKGQLAAILSNLSCAGYKPRYQDTLVFGTGKSASGKPFERPVEEDMCKSKSGWALVDPKNHMEGFEPYKRAVQDQQ